MIYTYLKAGVHPVVQPSQACELVALRVQPMYFVAVEGNTSLYPLVSIYRQRGTIESFAFQIIVPELSKRHMRVLTEPPKNHDAEEGHHLNEVSVLAPGWT